MTRAGRQEVVGAEQGRGLAGRIVQGTAKSKRELKPVGESHPDRDRAGDA